jgi:hypothetical protein
VRARGLVEPFRGVERPRSMWRSVALILGMVGVLAEFSLSGSSEARNQATMSGLVVVEGGKDPPPGGAVRARLEPS